MMAISSDNIRELSRWLISGAVVFAAHGGVVAALATWNDPIAPGEPASAITVELAPMPMAPSSEKTDLAIDRPQEQQIEQMTPPEPVEKVEREPEPLVVQEPPMPEVPPDPPHTSAIVALPPPQPPQPKPKPQPKKLAVVTAPEAADRVAPRAVAPAPGMGPANSASMPSWKGLVSAHLQRHKNYPPAARSRREEGTAILSFTIDRHGRVTASGISRGSGYAELDQETLAMVRRAQPFPPPPLDIPGQQFPFTVPMRYYLQ